MFHHLSLLSAHIQGINFHTTTSAMSNKDDRSSTCLLQLMTIKSGIKNFRSLNILWDGEATLSLITFEKERELGKEINISCESGWAERPLLNEKGEVVMFQVHGIDKISTNVQQINLMEAIGLF